jgi:transposase-like protein
MLAIIDGMPSPRSDTEKAAVMAALLAGQSVTSVAQQYNIPKGTVSRWNKQAAEFHKNVPKKEADLEFIGDLLIELLKTEIQTLIFISRESRDSAWIKRQTADTLAVFTGVKHDKIIRMLEAFDSGNTDTQAPN